MDAVVSGKYQCLKIRHWPRGKEQGRIAKVRSNQWLAHTYSNDAFKPPKPSEVKGKIILDKKVKKGACEYQ